MTKWEYCQLGVVSTPPLEQDDFDAVRDDLPDANVRTIEGGLRILSYVKYQKVNGETRLFPSKFDALSWLGSEGWEMVGVTILESDISKTLAERFYFKRPADEKNG